jgi:hypothetical protein
VISSVMPFMLEKSWRVARSILKKLHPGRGRLPSRQEEVSAWCYHFFRKKIHNRLAFANWGVKLLPYRKTTRRAVRFHQTASRRVSRRGNSSRIHHAGFFFSSVPVRRQQMSSAPLNERFHTEGVRGEGFASNIGDMNSPGLSGQTSHRRHHPGRISRSFNVSIQIRHLTGWKWPLVLAASAMNPILGSVSTRLEHV